MKKILYILLSLLILSSCKETVHCDNLNLKNGKYYLNGSQVPFTGLKECDHDNGKLRAYGEYKNGISISEWAEYDRGGSLVAKGRILTEKEKGIFAKNLLEITNAERVDISISYEGYSNNEVNDLMTIILISKDSINTDNLGEYILDNLDLMTINEDDFIDISVIRKFNDFDYLLRLKPKSDNETERINKST